MRGLLLIPLQISFNLSSAAILRLIIMAFPCHNEIEKQQVYVWLQHCAAGNRLVRFAKAGMKANGFRKDLSPIVAT